MRGAGVNSPISSVFEELRARGEMALIPYLTAGFPTMDGFVENLRIAADNGANVIEIGIPFCDPIADGPTIQRSSQVALAGGARLPAIFDALAAVRAKEMKLPPLVFMSYLNPPLALGVEKLFGKMRDLNVSGLIPADLPVEESDEWLAAARRHGIDLIFLAAPTSTDERLRGIAERSSGFVYAVSRAGTTGARGELDIALPKFLARIRAATKTPIAVGFGISTPEHMRSLRGHADGAVVGSRLVDAIDRGEDVAALVRSLKEATRG